MGVLIAAKIKTRSKSEYSHNPLIFRQILRRGTGDFRRKSKPDQKIRPHAQIEQLMIRRHLSLIDIDELKPYIVEMREIFVR